MTKTQSIMGLHQHWPGQEICAKNRTRIARVDFLRMPSAPAKFKTLEQHCVFLARTIILHPLSDMTIVRFCKYHEMRKLGRTTFRETSLSVVSSLKTEARESELDHVSTGKLKCQGYQLLGFLPTDGFRSAQQFQNLS